jgi:hypothetical protein
MTTEKKQKKGPSETDIQKIVNYYFYTRGLSLEEIKEDAKKKKIIYSRHTRPAKSILELAGSVQEAQRAIGLVASWAQSRKLEYSLETVLKKWLELNQLKPKEIPEKPFYNNMPLIWNKARGKWYAIDDGGEWLEFVGKESDIEWRKQE